MKLQEIKEQIAVKEGYITWSNLQRDYCRSPLDNIINSIAEGYNAELLEQNKQMKEALTNLMNDIGGGKKACEHDFTCACAFNSAKDLLTQIQNQNGE